MEDKILKFREKIKEKKLIDSMLSILHWDLETVAPIGGQPLISTLIGDLSLKSYNLTTSKDFMSLIKDLEKEKNLDEITKKEIELLKEEIDNIRVIPANEYKEYSELTASAQGIWEKARENNDFNSFAPTLKKIFEYSKRFISYRKKSEDLYSTVLNDYEKGMNIDKLDKFFKNLKDEIVPLLKEVAKKQNSNEVALAFKVSKESQKKLSEDILNYIGFDFDRGVISESAHPFTLTIDRDDVRITTRFVENLPFSSLFSTIHEGGHGIYEQNVGIDLKETTLSDGTSMGMHESQSRFYENIVGRSKEFWTGYRKRAAKYYKELEDTSIDKIYRGINIVRPSLIRVEADELTYSLHIMIRYEIEKGIFSGEYSIDELPSIWNEKMKEYLGVEPQNDSEGVLQDVHWACGLIGYFPSYALGNVYSIQILNAMKKDLDISKLLEKGELEPIKEWLNEKIHKFGKLKTSEEILKDVTGEEINSTYYIEYLKEKYRKLYS